MNFQLWSKRFIGVAIAVAYTAPSFAGGDDDDEDQAFFSFGMEIEVSDKEMEWAHKAATPACPWRCQLTNIPNARALFTRTLKKPSCENCADGLYPSTRHNAKFIQSRLTSGEPIFKVAEELTDTVPCPQMPGLQVTGRSKCLVGHMAYALLCFIRKFEDYPTHALIWLEMAMDIAKFVQNDVGPGRLCGDWGFRPADIAWNYRFYLSHVFHQHNINIPMHLQRWQKAPENSTCPGPRIPEQHENRAIGDVVSSPADSRATVMCLVLALLPKESKQAAAIVATYAADCDSLFFITASESEGPPSLYGYPVINIRRYFPDVPADSDHHTSIDTRNTIYKTLYMFLIVHHLSKHELPDLTCRLDIDTLFIPNNVRRILACRNFSTDIPFALGMNSYVHKFQQPGAVFPFGGAGICLSRAAVRAYMDFYMNGGFHPATSVTSWQSAQCGVGPGHWDDVVLGVCLQAAMIPLSGWSADCRGRELFLPFQLEESAQLKPPNGPMRLALAASEGVTDTFNYWRYRTLQHYYCDNTQWIGDYPVSFHRFGPTTDLALYAELREGKRLPDGALLRVWDGRVVDDKVCADLIC